MAQRTKEYLKTRFESADFPTEFDFIDLIDSLQLTLTLGEDGSYIILVTDPETGETLITIDTDKLEEILVSKDLPTGLNPDSDIEGVFEDLRIKLDTIVTEHLKDGSVTYDKLAEDARYKLPIASENVLGGIKVGTNLLMNPDTGVLSATGTIGSIPTGPAGGDLYGEYPNPEIRDGSITIDKLEKSVIPTRLPNPQTLTVNDPNNSTNIVYDGTQPLVYNAPVFPSIPTTLPPSGKAGGDLVGPYPNPTIRTDYKAPNPQPLTIVTSEGSLTYDGSVAANINIEHTGWDYVINSAADLPIPDGVSTVLVTNLIELTTYIPIPTSVRLIAGRAYYNPISKSYENSGFRFTTNSSSSYFSIDCMSSFVEFNNLSITLEDQYTTAQQNLINAPNGSIFLRQCKIRSNTGSNQSNVIIFAVNTNLTIEDCDLFTTATFGKLTVSPPARLIIRNSVLQGFLSYSLGARSGSIIENSEFGIQLSFTTDISGVSISRSICRNCIFTIGSNYTGSISSSYRVMFASQYNLIENCRFEVGPNVSATGLRTVIAGWLSNNPLTIIKGVIFNVESILDATLGYTLVDCYNVSNCIGLVRVLRSYASPTSNSAYVVANTVNGGFNTL